MTTATAAPARLEVWIPGRIETPNSVWRLHPMKRHKAIKLQKAKALMAIHRALVDQRVPPFTGPARVTFTLHRTRLLDLRDNDAFAVKGYRDALCPPRRKKGARRVLVPLADRFVVLPKGDGPTSGYTFAPVRQVQVRTPAEEGVRVVVEALA